MFFSAYVFLSADIFMTFARHTSNFLIGWVKIKAILQPFGTKYCILMVIVILKASVPSGKVHECGSKSAVPRIVGSAVKLFTAANITSAKSRYITFPSYDEICWLEKGACLTMKQLDYLQN